MSNNDKENFNSNLNQISDLYNKAVKSVKASPKNEVNEDLISEMVNSLLNLQNKNKEGNK